jgi:carbonic anhydrase/acetyltransferase-like protein (isoleucine patch superfamily)
MASTGKHSLLRGKGYYFSEGAKPLRKIFKRKIRSHLKIDPKTLKPISDTSEPVPSPEPTTPTEEEKKDLTLNITTSSAISRVNVKFLAVYIPIFWMAGLIVTIFWYWFLSDRNWEIIIPLLPLTIFASIYFFIFACMLFSKLFLILINLIHKPKEGVFRAEIGDKDFEFWMLRTELKKISLWLMRSSPFPWLDVLVFKLFGVNMDTSSFLYDTWCDGEFIQFGRKNLIGQGANIMSSMVVGKYLIIRKVIIDDYVLVGGMTSVAPGTMAGKEALLGAISFTVYNQILDPGWVYLGMPMTKYKPNKYAESRRDVISKKDVDEKKRFNIEYEINIDEDKKNNKG